MAPLVLEGVFCLTAELCNAYGAFEFITLGSAPVRPSRQLLRIAESLVKSHDAAHDSIAFEFW